MARKLFAWIVLAFMGSPLLMCASAQEITTVPTCRPDMKIVAQVLAEYDVEHPKDIAFGQYWGATNTHEKRMLISQSGDIAHRQKVVFHELAHACYHIRGIRLPEGIEESMVQEIAESMYQEYFGIGVAE
jgi:hypothetical protein